MAAAHDVPSTSGIGTKRQRTQYWYSILGLGKNRYKGLRIIRKIEKLSQVKSPIIKSFLGGTAPYKLSNENTYEKTDDIDIRFHYTTHGHVVYFSFLGSRTVYMYKSTIDTWYQLPDVPLRAQSGRAELPVCVTTIQGELTAIGKDNKLYTLTGQGAKQQWTEEYPPMPRGAPRYHQPAYDDTYDYLNAALNAFCVGEALIVFTCTDIKIMNTVSKQWSTAAASFRPSIEERSGGDAKFYDSHLWVIYYNDSKCIKYHLDSLLSSCEPPIFEQVPPAQASPTEFLCREIGSNPALSSNGTLIGEGCVDSNLDYSRREIRKYNLNKTNNPTNSWEGISLESESVGFLRKKEGAPIVALPDNKFMTIGLHTDRVLFFTID